LVDCSRFVAGITAQVCLKLEKFNVAGSVKDRVALHIVAEAERTGRLQPGGAIIESSSGNLGIALAFIGALRGYRVIIIVDPKASEQNIRIMRAYGAEVLVETEVDSTGNYHETRIERARQLERSISGSYWVNQTNNPLNVEAHRLSTGREILRDTGGELTACVMAVSSGGHVSGVAETLKDADPAIKVVAVDVEGSSIFGAPGKRYVTPGMGLSWQPSTLRDDLIDEAYLLSDSLCFSAARFLAKRGLFVGPSSGAVALACYHLALAGGPGGRIVGICPDSGERYMDTVFSDNWVKEHGLVLADSEQEIIRAMRELRPYKSAEQESILCGVSTSSLSGD
jgi:cystathionine beta-synthase/cysteine synthase A